jgi:hypothetical protein
MNAQKHFILNAAFFDCSCVPPPSLKTAFFTTLGSREKGTDTKVTTTKNPKNDLGKAAEQKKLIR